jgi:hypothetical protein
MISELSTSQVLDRMEIASFKGMDFVAANLPEKGAFVTIKATVTHVHHASGEISYSACPTGGCGKKVTLVEGTGKWACSKCNKEFSEVCIFVRIFI